MSGGSPASLAATHSMHIVFIALLAVGIGYAYLYKMSGSDNSNNDIYVDIGGKKVPWNSVNKPHSVVLDVDKHKPVPNPDTFPEVEPAAKEREQQLAQERAEANKNS